MDADESGAGSGDGATLTVGPTSGGVVRILVEGGGRETPMDFDPDEAEEVADELRAAADRARAAGTRRAGAAPEPARPAPSEGVGRRR